MVLNLDVRTIGRSAYGRKGYHIAPVKLDYIFRFSYGRYQGLMLVRLTNPTALGRIRANIDRSMNEIQVMTCRFLSLLHTTGASMFAFSKD